MEQLILPMFERSYCLKLVRLYEGTITQELLSIMVVLLESIFIGDGFFAVAIGDIPIYSR